MPSKGAYTLQRNWVTNVTKWRRVRNRGFCVLSAYSLAYLKDTQTEEGFPQTLRRRRHTVTVAEAVAVY